jgi:hypothetical protein
VIGMVVDKKDLMHHCQKKKTTKKDLEVLKKILTLKYPDQAPFNLDNTKESIEREYFRIMISNTLN